MEDCVGVLVNIPRPLLRPDGAFSMSGVIISLEAALALHVSPSVSISVAGLDAIED